MSPTATPDRAELARRVTEYQRATWADGDYGRIGITLQITGERLLENMDPSAGDTFLDIASGNGNAALAAARRNCRVTATDFVPDLLGQSQARAVAEFADIDYAQVDAEDLPYEDGTFDHVASTFGVMFAPRQPRAARELLRVCRPGGRIGLASWTPDGFAGRHFQLLCDYVPLPAGLRMPTSWGTRDFVARQFGERVSDAQMRERAFVFRYRSPDHWWYIFTTFCGLTRGVFRRLDDEQRAALRDDVMTLIGELNRAHDGTMVVESTYLECVITR